MDKVIEIMEEDCPTCELIATGGMFIGGECEDHKKL